MARKRKGFHPVKRPGALTARAKREHTSLGALERKDYNAPGLRGKQARFAAIAKHWHHGGKRKRRT